MTVLLKNAFDKATQLPDAAQELLAQQLLDDIEAEMKWDKILYGSQKKLKKMSEKAMMDYRTGKIHKKGFDEI